MVELEFGDMNDLDENHLRRLVLGKANVLVGVLSDMVSVIMSLENK